MKEHLNWSGQTSAVIVAAICLGLVIAKPDKSGPSVRGKHQGEEARQAIRIPSYPQSLSVGTLARDESTGKIRLCQALGPTTPQCVTGIDGARGCGPEARWNAHGPIPWQAFGQGEYVGPARPEHMPVYRLRVDDQVEFVYRLTRNQSSEPYQLNVGDRIQIESLTDEQIDRELVIQPDGSISLRLLGQVQAARRTVDQLRLHLEKLYEKYYKLPAITVTPLSVNTRLEDLRATVDNRAGVGGQSISTRITPEGTVQLPGLSSIYAQGLTFDELKREVDARYLDVVQGVEVTPILVERAPRFVYVLGEVRRPGRYDLVHPTTVMQSIALSGGWNNGGNLRQIVVFRRAEDWRLIATKLDLRGALLGKRPSPADEIWLRDSDIVVIPKSAVLLADDFIELIFTRGIYGVLPFRGSINFQKLSTI